MPTPAKTSPAALVGIARDLVNTGGADALTLNAVAAGAGIKPPSLYKHFADRATLLKAVEIAVLHELEAALRAGTKGRTARRRLESMARTYRAFALERPLRYGVIYSGNAGKDEDIRKACLLSAAPLFEELRAAGIAEARILPLARALTAFLHGFVSMEIVGAFQLGGLIEDAFTQSLDILLREVDG